MNLFRNKSPSALGYEAEESQVIETYNSYLWKKVIFIIICVAVAIVVAGVAMTIGAYQIGFFESYQIIWQHITGNIVDSSKDLVIWNIRMPRILAGIVAGLGLAAAGAVMQSTIKNPLADPYTTGISSGASFGATLSIVVGFTVIGGRFATIANAFIFSLIPMFLIIVISTYRKASPTMIILAGIAVMYLFNSMTTLFKLMTSPDKLADVYNWEVGTLGLATWEDIPLMLTITVAGVFVMMLLSNKINVLASGDESAKSLGIDADKLRIIALAVVSLVAAAIVSFTGIIGFVGLVCPHIVRLFIGSDNRFLIPASAAFGAAFLLIADLIGRTIIAPAVLQVGVVTAFIGGPMLIYLLMRSKKDAW